MSKRSKFYKQLVDKQNSCIHTIGKNSKNIEEYPKTPLLSQRHNTPKVSSADKYAFSKEKTQNSRQRYKSYKRQNTNTKASRLNTSGIKTRKQELMQWYKQIEREYEVNERFLDCQMLKLKLDNSRTVSSKISVIKNKRSKIIPIVEQRSSLYDIPIKISRQIDNIQRKSKVALQQIQKILNAISQHITCQSQLRLLKHKLNSQNSAQIQQLLYIKHNILPKYIKLSNQQFDPFIKQQSSPISNQILAQQIHKQIQNVSKNWRNNLKKRFSLKQCQDFFSVLDFDQNKYVDLKIFVRELSIVLKSNLRKRDVVKIFQNLSEESVITLKSLVRQLSYE